ncbi:hypothetical protein Anapl_01430 [Anas platyrhynchos]|uniref:Uncharacterized protein n=1 Tax=Anas platyrhynchos TaxID=8839 RepID=R0LFQ9_ANAPL|nr:hypothetical protein Anapl_01430 [Anas platyrhynchos]
MENLLSRDNQALLAFTDTLYAMQQHKVKQRATDGTESADMYFKEYFKLTRVPPLVNRKYVSTEIKKRCIDLQLLRVGCGSDMTDKSGGTRARTQSNATSFMKNFTRKNREVQSTDSTLLGCQAVCL